MVDAFLATLLHGFTGLDQLFQVVSTFLTHPGISAQACQPNFARVAAHLTLRTLGVIFLLQNHFGHALHLTLEKIWRNCPWKLGLSTR
ncbi:hypothetical protein D3C75_1234430 [compost metagenome]